MRDSDEITLERFFEIFNDEQFFEIDRSLVGFINIDDKPRRFICRIPVDRPDDIIAPEVV